MSTLEWSSVGVANGDCDDSPCIGAGQPLAKPCGRRCARRRCSPRKSNSKRHTSITSLRTSQSQTYAYRPPTLPKERNVPPWAPTQTCAFPSTTSQCDPRHRRRSPRRAVPDRRLRQQLRDDPCLSVKQQPQATMRRVKIQQFEISSISSPLSGYKVACLLPISRQAPYRE